MSETAPAAPGPGGRNVRRARPGPGGDAPAGVCPGPGGFSEHDAWREVCAGWCPLFAGFRERGFSVEWHRFQCPFEFDWARSFHPRSLEICLNLAGRGRLGRGRAAVELPPRSAVFYRCGDIPPEAWRLPAERHEFFTVELSRPFLAGRLTGREPGMHPLARAFLTGTDPGSAVAETAELDPELERFAQGLRHPPPVQAARALWYESRVLDLAARFLFRATPEAELFCDRQRRVARERVGRVVALLEADLVQPPDLEAISRQVGCSPFHLSRTFSAELGVTIPQYLRRLRLDHAAGLLRAGGHNVTEAAMAVGYSSLSHFSQAFHEQFGCCPGLYPLPGPQLAQKARGAGRRPPS
jgi:AraC-like DNA-binding protein